MVATMVRSVRRTLTVYGAWILSSALALYAFAKTHEVIWAAIRMYVGRWGQSAAAGWSMVPLGLILLIAVIALEDYYRKGMESGVLLNRFLKVTAIEVAVAVVMLVLMAVLAASA